MVFTEQQLQVKKLVDVQQDIEIDALNNGVGALSSTMQNGFIQASNNFSDIQNSLESMNTLSNERYNGVTGSVNTLSNAMTQGFLDMGNTVANVADGIQGQFNDVNNYVGGFENNVNNYVGGFENNVNTALRGIQNNFYDMENDYLDRFNQVNANISGSINNFNEQITNKLSVNVFSADTMIYNVSATPVSSLTALGYDSNGKVIPVTVIANRNVVLPENANYLYTDAAGTPYAGMADTAVSTNENLVTSHAVYNAVNNISADLNGLRNDVNNNILDIDNNIYFIMDVLGVFTPMNYISSINPVNYRTVQTVVFTKGTTGKLWSNSSLLGNRYYSWDNTTNTLKFSSPTGIIVFNSNMDRTFYKCKSLNQNILISNSVTSMAYTFGECTSLNQNILIPNSVTNMVSTFGDCTSLNQNILIPNSVTNIERTFYRCTSLNQNILIPNSVTNMVSTFDGCNTLNQNIFIPNSITNMMSTFNGCNTLNQNILIPNSVTNMMSTFVGCTSLNQNILIPNSVTNMVSTFNGCNTLNQNILIPNSITDIEKTFYECTSLNQNILIPNSVRNMVSTFGGCTSLNQNIYVYSDKLKSLQRAFTSCSLLSGKYIHIRSSIPMDTSNTIYNALVNNFTGVNWSGRVVNDLPAPTTWPPAN